MFFLLSKILNALCYPLPLGLLLFLLFAVIRWWPPAGGKLRQAGPSRNWTLFWMAFILLWACSTAPIADLLVRPLEAPYKHPVGPESVDAIVVLGGCSDLELSDEDHLKLNENADRFIAALELTRRYPGALLIFSGGSGSLFDQVRREAPNLRAAAIRLGVPARRILIDADSRNTRENALACEKLLAHRHASSVLLVTSGFHMKRALACFHKLGMSPTPYAVDFRGHGTKLNPLSWVPDVGNLGLSTTAIREYVGMLIYKAKRFA